MHKLVLIRHGESTWNLENRFTGWTDVDLTPTGVSQAMSAGKLLKAEGYEFDLAFTSVLKRAIHTLWYALDEMDCTWLPVVKDWRLNERHYGALQGLNKADMAKQYGDEQVLVWRRSYDTPRLRWKPPTPQRARRPPLRRWAAENVPLTECLKDTVARVLPFWNEVHGARHPFGQARGGGCARQLHPGAGQVPGQHLRQRHRGPEHSQRDSAGLRAGRQPQAHPPLLSGRCRSGCQGRRRSGFAGKSVKTV